MSDPSIQVCISQTFCLHFSGPRTKFYNVVEISPIYSMKIIRIMKFKFQKPSRYSIFLGLFDTFKEVMDTNEDPAGFI